MKVISPGLLIVALFLVPQQRPASTTGQLKDFTLTVTTPQRSYLELEPIPIVITLKNETNRPLMGHSLFYFDASYFHLFVHREDGTHDLGGLSTYIADYNATHREFRPGEEAKKTQCLDVRLSKAFPKPGKYKLTAELRSLDGSPAVSSQPFEVEIVAPQGVEAEALKFIRTNGDPDYFFTGIQRHRRPAIMEPSVVENFLALYGDTAYADDATYLLGEIQFAKREYLKARTIFQGLAKQPDYPFAGDVAQFLQLIDRELDKQGRP